MPVEAGEVVAEELAIAGCWCRLEFHGGGATACAALAPAQSSARPRFAAEEGQPWQETSAAIFCAGLLS